MKSLIHRFTLDMHSTLSQISIPVMLGDTCREFRFILSDSGNPYIIQDGCLAKISIKRPSESHLEEFCAIEDNTTIVYKFEQNTNTAIEEGVHDCDVTLYGLDGRHIATPKFTMVVSERVINSDDIVLTDEDYTAVDAMLSAEAQRQNSESQRNKNEASRALAESGRVNAETQRAEAEAQRVKAEEERITAGKVALQAVEDAKSKAQSAENFANSAKGEADRAEEAATRTEELITEYITEVDTLIGGEA